MAIASSFSALDLWESQSNDRYFRWAIAIHRRKVTSFRLDSLLNYTTDTPSTSLTATGTRSAAKWFPIIIVTPARPQVSKPATNLEVIAKTMLTLASHDSLLNAVYLEFGRGGSGSPRVAIPFGSDIITTILQIGFIGCSEDVVAVVVVTIQRTHPRKVSVHSAHYIVTISV
jgi:hypothetical protein